MKTCSKCLEQKPLTGFYTRSQNGKKYPESRCKTCSIARTRAREKQNPEYLLKNRVKWSKNQADKLKKERAAGINREKHLFHDARRSDRKRGYQNDLTLEFILDQINMRCSYCGDDESSKMTLDRIDNTIGHLKSNVVPSCHRCNMVRGNMPIAAWEIIAGAMRRAREEGCFGNWMPGNTKLVEHVGISPTSQPPCKGSAGS